MATICVPVCCRRVEELSAAVDLAASVGNLVELRLDYLKQPAAALSAVRDLRQRLAQIIITMRAPEQGGAEFHTRDERRHFWSLASTLPQVLFDIEFDFLNTEELAIDRNRVICSHHDFTGMPANLETIYERMAATPARIIKIAVQANDAPDCLRIFRLIDRANREGRELIAIGMGPAGAMTRVLGPARGSFLTYGALDDASATAPGQLSARELRELYRIDHVDRQTAIMGVIGSPVAHSISPQLHNVAFERAGENAVFLPFEVRNIDAFMKRMVRSDSREIDWHVRGLSVTAPHKTAVMKHLDWIDPAATEIGAVNTIVLDKGGLRGYNTDAAAFLETLKLKIGAAADLNCAVIGGGGAARGVVWALRRAGNRVILFARDRSRAEPLAAHFGIEIRDLAKANFDGFDLVINATPLGTRGKLESESPADAVQLRGVRWAYDLVYNPLATRFLREAIAAGCETIGGLDMLIAQAVSQFKIWTGKTPDVWAMRAAAEASLGGLG